MSSKGNNSTFEQALAALRRGEVAVFPTDTVYGLGVAVSSETSPDAIYALKQRDEHKPIPWLVADATALDIYARNVPDYARVLAQSFWPGALTLIVHASDAAPQSFCAADGTLALRCPAHEAVLELIAQLAAPLATSSANRQSQAPVYSASDLDPLFAAAGIPVVDGGTITTPVIPATALAPSTIVSCLGTAPEIIRHGALSDAAINEALKSSGAV